MPDNENRSIIQDILTWDMSDNHKLTAIVSYLVNIQISNPYNVKAFSFFYSQAESILATHNARSGLTGQQLEDMRKRKVAKEAKFSELLTEFSEHAMDTEESRCGCAFCEEFFIRVNNITTNKDYRNLLKGPLFAILIKYLSVTDSLEESFSSMLADIYRLRTYTRREQLNLMLDSPPVAEEGKWIDSNSGPGYTPTEAFRIIYSDKD